jgi:ketosteroid isomerase-like protein
VNNILFLKQNYFIMKKSTFLVFAVSALFFAGCKKESAQNPSVAINSPNEFSMDAPENSAVSSTNQEFWKDKCAQRFVSSDQKAIQRVRQANNAALKGHNAAGVAAAYLDNFFLLTSTNGFFTGKEAVQNIYQSVFTARLDVLFVRTPSAIMVNRDWNMASENGNWTGTWTVNGAPIAVGGDYYAKWHKIDGIWKLRSEVYTQFDCSGDVVCNNKPNLQ